MTVPLFLKSLEESGFSTWLREANSVFAFYFILLFHTFGLALLVGANMVVDLRILGVARELPLAPLKRFFPIMWTGFTLNVITGVLLVIAYPTKALTNPVFYLKLALIALAVIVMQKTYTRVFAHIVDVVPADADDLAPAVVAPANAAAGQYAVSEDLNAAPRSSARHSSPTTLPADSTDASERQTSAEEMAAARGRTLAIWSLALWLAAITAGRLLAYTYTYLLYGHPPIGR